MAAKVDGVPVHLAGLATGATASGSIGVHCLVGSASSGVAT